MFVVINQCDLLVLKDKNEFFLHLVTGKIRQKLVYLQKEDLFIHQYNWSLALKSGEN